MLLQQYLRQLGCSDRTQFQQLLGEANLNLQQVRIHTFCVQFCFALFARNFVLLHSSLTALLFPQWDKAKECFLKAASLYDASSATAKDG